MNYAVADDWMRAMQIPSVPSSESAHFCITLYDDLITHYVFDADIFLQKCGKMRTTVLSGEWEPVPSEAYPTLVLGTRIYLDDNASVRFCPPLWEPTLQRFPAGVIVHRIKREVCVAGSVQVVWSLLRLMDGHRRTSEILAQLSENYYVSASLLAGLVATGAVDISGRQIARFLHTATKNEVLPGSGMDYHDIALLVTDSNYRAYPHAQRFPVREDVPEALAHLYAITRARRSYANYSGAPILRRDLEAVLTTACGVTGALKWADREVNLRAYPSAGALYAVEVYPVVFAVEGLEAGIYHYRPTESVLEVVRKGIERTAFINAAVPIQKDMIQGAAVMICLTGSFERFERKYGEGGYRILAAETGHISENLILAATALGLHARPCGGVFEQMLNAELGLETDIEQFLLSVIVGYADVSDDQNHRLTE